MIVAAALLPLLLFGGVSTYMQAQYYDTMQIAGYAPQPGLTADGMRVRNIFAYDASGRPLTGVQLFDQDGRPLTTVGYEGLSLDWQEDQSFAGGGGPVPVAETGPGLQPVWNIYPLRELPAGSWDTIPADAAVPDHPIPVIGGIGSPSLDPTPVPSATAVPTPTATAAAHAP